MSRATATAKQQMSVIQEAIKAISFIFQQIQLISNFNTDQVRNQQNVSKSGGQTQAPFGPASRQCRQFIHGGGTIQPAVQTGSRRP